MQALGLAALVRELVDLPGRSGPALVEALAERPGGVRAAADAVEAAVAQVLPS